MKAAIKRLLDRHPAFKSLAQRLLTLAGKGSVSKGYVALDAAQAGAEATRLRDSWQNESLPARQRRLVEKQLASFRQGAKVDVFDVMIQAIADTRSGPGQSLLEIGCSSGYYSEVLQIAGVDVAYSGCDYSPAFIDLAREKYPAIDFRVEDAAALSYPDAAFDIVVSGCCLLHIPEYETAIAETARVARNWAIFHRTAVLIGKPTTYFTKTAYDIETVEIHFNEADFLASLATHGLELVATHTLAESVVAGLGSANRTYVCRTRAA